MSNIVSFVFKASDALSGPLRAIARRVGILNGRLALLRESTIDASQRFTDFRTELNRFGRTAATVNTGRLSDDMGTIGTNMAGLEERTISASQRFANFRTRLADFGRTAVGVGKDLLTKVTLPISVLGGFMIKAASDAEEVNQKFGVVFKSVTGQANKTASNLAKNFGLSTRASKEFLSGTGDLLTGFGFTGKEALDLSTKVNELAVDLASFTNIEGGTKRASAALTSALLGEREAVKSLGIAILEEDVKRRVQKLLTEGQTFASLRQAKAIATLQLATEQSKNAIGDFARSQKSFANQTRIARAALDDMAVQLGTVLLPFATKLAGMITKLARKFGELSPTTKKIVLVLAGLAALLPPLIILVGGLAIAFGAITLPITLTIVAVAALVAAGIFLAVKWDSVQTRLVNIADNIKFAFTALKNSFMELPGVTVSVEALGRVFTTLGSIIVRVAGFIFDKFQPVVTMFIQLKDAVFAFGSSIGAAVSGPLGRLFAAVTGEVNLLKPSTVVAPTNTLQAQRSQTDVNINMNAPKGAVNSMESSTRGSIDGLNLGLNMATSPGG